MSGAPLRVVELHDLNGLAEAVDLFCEIWQAGPADTINVGTLRALAHAGNYVVGAYRGDTFVGAAVGFLGAGHLHSHIAGVRPGLWATGVGYALKQHQRMWCLERSIDTVRWTYDPLVRRNAYFNLHKLGAVAEAYLEDFYGPMTDGLNAGDASDRVYIRWDLTSPRVEAAARGEHPEALPGGAGVLLDRVGGAPVPQAAPHERALLVAVPEDVEALRRKDSALAARWRFAVREALTSALDGGFAITGVTRDGFYLLERLCG